MRAQRHRGLENDTGFGCEGYTLSMSEFGRLAMTFVAAWAVTIAVYAAEIRGQVRLVGGVPAEEEPAELKGVCAKWRTDGRDSDGPVVAGAGGGLKNAVVFIDKGVPETEFAPEADPVVIEIRRCRAIPRVIAVHADRPLVVRNADSVFHNAHGIGELNPEFNLGLPRGISTSARKLPNQELGFRLGCEVHGGAQAFVSSFSHPFFAVTDETGFFVIPGVPPGTYGVRAWHERFGQIGKDVTVGEEGPALVDLPYLVP